MAQLKGHKEPVTSLEFLKNNFRLVTVSTDKTIKVWDIKKEMVIFDVRLVHISFDLVLTYIIDILLSNFLR